MPGYMQSTDDGYAAYCQCFLGGGRGKGIRTFVDIPRHRWPKEWIGKYKRPVIQLILDLYGHPDAGGYWEKHCSKHLQSCGFDPIPNWPSMFWNAELQLMLMVYVDDFKLAGPKENLSKGWDIIRKAVDMEEPQKLGHLLGCTHEQFSMTLSDGTVINGIKYNAEIS